MWGIFRFYPRVVLGLFWFAVGIFPPVYRGVFGYYQVVDGGTRTPDVGRYRLHYFLFVLRSGDLWLLTFTAGLEVFILRRVRPFNFVDRFVGARFFALEDDLL